jgi:hypothetical protein
VSRNIDGRSYQSREKAEGQEGTRGDNITAEEIKAATKESGLLMVLPYNANSYRINVINHNVITSMRTR